MTLVLLNQPTAFAVKELPSICYHVSQKLNQHLKILYFYCLSDAGGRWCGGGVHTLTVLHSTEGYVGPDL